MNDETNGDAEVVVKSTWKDKLTFDAAMTEGTFLGKLCDWEQSPYVYSLSVCQDDERILLITE